MLKLLKHEFQKQFSRLIGLLILLVISEGMFVIGYYVHNDQVMGRGLAIFAFLTIFGCIGIGIDSILTMINDLSNNHNYMLFMTPNNGYKILGAKVLENLISTLGLIVICVLTMIGDYFLVGGKSQYLINLHINTASTASIVHSFSYGLMIWLALVALIILSIVLSLTLFKDAHHNFLLSLLVFIGLSILMSTIYNTIGRYIPSSGDNIYNVIYTIIMIVGCYVTSATLMDHQLSL